MGAKASFNSLVLSELAFFDFPTFLPPRKVFHEVRLPGISKSLDSVL